MIHTGLLLGPRIHGVFAASLLSGTKSTQTAVLYCLLLTASYTCQDAWYASVLGGLLEEVCFRRKCVSEHKV